MKNLESRAIISNNIFDSLTQELSKKFLYQNIMVISSNNDYFSEKLRVYRNKFNFACCKSFEYQLLDNTQCVVLEGEQINVNNIEICKEFNLPIILLLNEYVSFYNLYLISSSNLLLRIIINEKEYKQKLHCNNCKICIDELLLNALLVENNFNNLFYNNGSKFLSLSELKSKSQLIDKIQNCFASCKNINENLIIYLMNNKPNSLDEFSFTYLIVQIIFNLYKIFITNISPMLVGKINDFNFDYNKFWFIKNMCFCEINQQIDYFLNMCIKAKLKLCCEDIDYFYSVAKQYNNLEIKKWLRESVKNFNNSSLLKIIHNMGLLEF